MNYNFDWDPYKSKQNIKKHKISFEIATEIFQDFMAISLFDEEHSTKEDRWITIGKSINNQLIVIIHTFKIESNNQCLIRIISARKATKSEIKQYEDVK